MWINMDNSLLSSQNDTKQTLAWVPAKPLKKGVKPNSQFPRARQKHNPPILLCMENRFTPLHMLENSSVYKLLKHILCKQEGLTFPHSPADRSGG